MTEHYESHLYALMLPPLTDEEYAALRADIEQHGILYPVILDEDDRVLDGVHRVRIATELGVNVPVSRHHGLADERKLHLAVGLNMRRRNLDTDRRRALVRRLHADEGLSVRKIAEITGWSKSTVDRDLKTSPFEQMIAALHENAAGLRQLDEDVAENPALVKANVEFADAVEGVAGLMGWLDGEWKRGAWPPDPEEHFLASASLYTVRRRLEQLAALIRGEEEPPDPVDWQPWWNRTTRERHIEVAEEFAVKGLLLQAPKIRYRGVMHGELSQMGQAEERA